MHFLDLLKWGCGSSKSRSYILKPALGAARKKILLQARPPVSLEGLSVKGSRSPSPPIWSGSCEIWKRESPRARMVKPSARNRTMTSFSHTTIFQFRGFVFLQRDMMVPVVTSSAFRMSLTDRSWSGRDRAHKTTLSIGLLSRRTQKKGQLCPGGIPRGFFGWTILRGVHR